MDIIDDEIGSVQKASTSDIIFRIIVVIFMMIMVVYTITQAKTSAENKAKNKCACAKICEHCGKQK